MELLLLIMIFVVFMYVLCLEKDINKKINRKYRNISKQLKEINKLKQEIRKTKRETNELWSVFDCFLEMQGDELDKNEKL